MKGVRSKYKEFQLQPDFVVTPKLGPKLQAYIQDFRENHERPLGPETVYVGGFAAVQIHRCLSSVLSKTFSPQITKARKEISIRNFAS